jgi:hypothetical protein
MFEDILSDPLDDLELQLMQCEDCEIASYILSNFPGKKVLCQKTGYHMLYDDWCLDWKERRKVKP